MALERQCAVKGWRVGGGARLFFDTQTVTVQDGDLDRATVGKTQAYPGYVGKQPDGTCTRGITHTRI